MNELKENSKKKLIITLMDLSSKDEQEFYKASVPFVDVPGELMCQWDSHFIKNGQKWFKEIWTKYEWEELIKFDNKFRKLTKKITPNTPDVPEIFGINEWLEIMKLSKDLLKKLTK